MILIPDEFYYRLWRDMPEDVKAAWRQRGLCIIRLLVNIRNIVIAKYSGSVFKSNLHGANGEGKWQEK